MPPHKYIKPPISIYAMANFWKIVNKVIRAADVLLLVMDSRIPQMTRNEEIEYRVKKNEKELIYVLNKCDLGDKKELEALKKELGNCVFVSTKEHYGITKLREAIMRTGKKIAKAEGRDKIIIGVLGYPNTGKSSVINFLRGSAAAKTSPFSGFTRGYQYVNAGNNILMIDTPGVISYSAKDEATNAIVGGKDFSKLKEPDLAAMELITLLGGKVEKYYGVEPGDDEMDTLDKIAVKMNRMKKGGEPDSKLMARMIMKDWQHGRITFQ